MVPVIILIILGCCMILFAIIADVRINGKNGICGMSFIAMAGTIFVFTGMIEDSTKPKAIDVYRGNTTLEITYRDSIAIDSVVVYKNN